MSTYQELMKQILQANPLITKSQILKKLEVEKAKTGGLLSDETLLRLIAAKYGVQVQQNQIQSSGVLSSSRLFAGLYDVTVEGHLIAVFPAKTFEGPEKSGKFATALLLDGEGILRVVLWNEKAELVEKGELKAGQTVKLLHGYTRQDRNGKTELHLGSKSQIENQPDSQKVHSLGRFTDKIKTLNTSSGNVNLSGDIKRVLGETTFIRSDSSVGSVTRLILADETGEVLVVLWNGKTAELERNLCANARLVLLNARVKEGQNGALEIHVDQNTYIDIQSAAEKLTKIAALSEDQIVNLEGFVLALHGKKNVTTQKGEVISLFTFDLKDEESMIRVSAWREHAEALEKLEVGNKIRLDSMYVKRGFGGKLELSTRNSSSIKVQVAN